MDRATFIAQPLIIGMTELFVIVVARRRPPVFDGISLRGHSLWKHVLYNMTP